MTSRHSQDAALGLPFALALFGHLALLAILIFSYQWSRLEVEPAGEILDAPTIDVSEVRKALKRAPTKPEPQPEPEPVQQPEPEPPKPDPQEEARKAALEREQLEKQRQQEEQVKLEAEKKAEEEAKRIALEKKKKKEAEEKKKDLEKKKKEEEKKKEELRKKEETDKKKKAEDEKRKKDEADKKKKDEADKKKKAEEEQKRKEEEKRRQQAEDELARELEAEASQPKGRPSDSDVAKYKGLIQNKVMRNWIKPENPNGEAILRLRLAPDGSVLDVMSCEGDRLMCESATRAVYKAEPLPVPQDKTLFEEYFKVLSLRMKP